MGEHSKKKNASGGRRKKPHPSSDAKSAARLEFEELFAPWDRSKSLSCDGLSSATAESSTDGDRRLELFVASRSDQLTRDELVEDGDRLSVGIEDTATDSSEFESATEEMASLVSKAVSEGFEAVQRRKAKSKVGKQSRSLESVPCAKAQLELEELFAPWNSQRDKVVGSSSKSSSFVSVCMEDEVSGEEIESSGLVGPRNEQRQVHCTAPPVAADPNFVLVEDATGEESDPDATAANLHKAPLETNSVQAQAPPSVEAGFTVMKDKKGKKKIISAAPSLNTAGTSADNHKDVDFPALSASLAPKHSKTWVKKSNYAPSTQAVRQNATEKSSEAGVKKSLLNGSNSAKPAWNALFANNRCLDYGVRIPFLPSDSKDPVSIKYCDIKGEDKEISCCLVGYFAGRSPGYHNLMKFIETFWKVKVNVLMHRSDWVILQFMDENAKDRVLLSGPYLVHNVPLILKGMPHLFTFEKEERSIVPVWIQLHNLPFECRTPTVLGKITSRVGKPVCSDKITFGTFFSNFARVLVEVDLALPLVQDVSLCLPNDKQYILDVVYERIPPFCSFCRVLGHISDSCEVAKCAKSQKEVSDGTAHDGVNDQMPNKDDTCVLRGKGKGASHPNLSPHHKPSPYPSLPWFPVPKYAKLAAFAKAKSKPKYHAKPATHPSSAQTCPAHAPPCQTSVVSKKPTPTNLPNHPATSPNLSSHTVPPGNLTTYTAPPPTMSNTFPERPSSFEASRPVFAESWTFGAAAGVLHAQQKEAPQQVPQIFVFGSGFSKHAGCGNEKGKQPKNDSQTSRKRTR